MTESQYPGPPSSTLEFINRSSSPRTARGISAGENRVARLCSAQRVWSLHAKKRGRNRRAGPPVHDDLVRRQFSAAGTNAVWLTDITEHPTAQGKLYLCTIKDLHSNRIVGYSLDSRMTASLAVAALRNANGLRSPTDTIVHSDRSIQFRSRPFVNTLSVNGLRGSMGRVGAWVTTQPWSRSSRCYRRTSSTNNAGPPARNYA